MIIIRTLYSDMVANLFKVGKELGNQYGNLMHASIGISGELAELQVSQDRENTIEELGDIEFYLEALKQQAELFGLKQTEAISMPVPPVLACNMGMLIAAGDILDICKKGWVYNKVPNWQELSLKMDVFEFMLIGYYHHLGLNRNEVRYQNQVKLIGPNGRYPEGQYSDAAAQARRDKEGAS